MRLAICDDNDLEREFLRSLLKKYFSETSIRCEFTLYDRGTALYYDVMEKVEYDIIFLDLFMGDSFGLCIAQKLRDLSYGGKIIFCTVSADYALESYSVYASGYILKPYSLKDIKRTLDRFLPEYQCDSYQVKQKSKIVYIPLNEIVYVESNNTKCILHRTENREYHVYKKLTEIETELNDPRFLRCHQSYIVNMNYVREANDVLLLQNGEEVLIRMKSKREIQQKVLEYKEKMGDTAGDIKS
ncbi:MAG: LytTR family DNA-binding domain-containing protein [Firmicutes bacterium]|nr:LytTR family DNA-binding domain-containing protein [Bacillota bacterium]